MYGKINENYHKAVIISADSLNKILKNIKTISAEKKFRGKIIL